MSATIQGVFPWGRSFDEYRGMFALTDDDLNRRIIGCGDGPAAFNAEMARRGKFAVACDPLYRFNSQEIRLRIHATKDVMLDLARQNAHRFVWDRIRSPEELAELRLAAMENFLADFDRGKREGRYLDQSLPSLDFPDASFDLAICSHFLFLYSRDFLLEFHIQSVREMCRVATEARVFPLLDMDGQPSAHVGPLLNELGNCDFDARMEKVAYEFQRGGNRMLRVTRR